MHGRPFDRARFVNDPLEQPPDCCVRERPSVRPLHAFEHVAFESVERSEEHTSELQSPVHLVCRLLLEKKNAGRLEALRECRLVDRDLSLREPVFLFLLIRPPPRPTLFPYTTLFRSERASSMIRSNSRRIAACESGPPFARSTLSSTSRSKAWRDRKSTRLNSSHPSTSYAVFCLKKKTQDGSRLFASVGS